MFYIILQNQLVYFMIQLYQNYASKQLRDIFSITAFLNELTYITYKSNLTRKILYSFRFQTMPHMDGLSWDI